ncbi:uroporphyrinogen-III C-methyltransferase [Pelotomaculum terephthalicicum JT]|uniref:uroporphyrinogen-III C-methyltransferase n=1 Tax=Pelotomaculum TaxID=191373 RepID=UPI0009CB4CED|nr:MULTISPECIES: uroporphyrinogen-III C-methyltransferase [Pelotomaculum]MCG9967600.1 uroporphyrinogen-III C-methyltransferase [Pelotomaculum terephthalicicum JT]OPX91667.1 MAG: Uroporphyrinogen-III C-methyltransferase [Pelotomaculum sp. PtaB.Bin117]OPY61831.1 MAG: Uroporphyrinogen-III C-methyltransferase [Pelotomaculum sp. PtaU1.Bin065]
MCEGVVYLVGAGPGNPKLITVRGLELIKKADTIIYDRLVAHRLLAFVRPGAEIVYAGKEPGCHALKQEEICRLMAEKAGAGKVVVRLKGGDPFVFGRGGEEAEALHAAGVRFEVVPGVTSAIAAPAYAGIPATHRDYASTLAIITGNEDPLKDDSSIAWDRIATSADTLIFLMGMANLQEITQRLINSGRSSQTPAALVRWGTRPEQRTLVGTLENIHEQAQRSGFTNPAVIIVGEVVLLREKLKWFENKPLFGKKILITRAREQASVLSEIIEAFGGEAVEFPTIKIAEPEDFAPLDQSIKELNNFNWVVFTSVNGVGAFFKRLRHHRKDIRELHNARLCAIGPKTRESLEKYGLLAEYMPGEYRAEEIARGMRGKLTCGERVLLPRAAEARKVLPAALSEMGAVVTEVAAYRTVPESGSGAALKEMLRRGEIDLVTFTSSSTVRYFADMVGGTLINNMRGKFAVACIGPVTAGTARELGLQVDVVAKEYTIEGLVEVIVKLQESGVRRQESE